MKTKLPTWALFAMWAATMTGAWFLSLEVLARMSARAR